MGFGPGNDDAALGVPEVALEVAASDLALRGDEVARVCTGTVGEGLDKCAGDDGDAEGGCEGAEGGEE